MVYSVNYYEEFKDDYANENQRLCKTKERAIKVFEEEKAIAKDNAERGCGFDGFRTYEYEAEFIIEGKGSNANYSLRIDIVEMEVEE